MVVIEVRLMVLARYMVSSKQTTGTGRRRVGNADRAATGQEGCRMPISIRSVMYYNLRDCYTILYRLPHQKQVEPGVCLYAVQW